MTVKDKLRALLKYKRFQHDKRDLIDYTFTNVLRGPAAFADLGGVWAVDAVYTFYTLDKYEVRQAFLVDTDFTPAVVKKNRKYPQLTLIEGNFGLESVLGQVGRIDAVFLFDVLLHQVSPDWDEILAMYASLADCLLVFNPQYTKTERSVRLLDLGFDEYFRNVPHDADHPLYKALREKTWEINPKHGRIWRDIHAVWQWGITDEDLIRKMEDLGFSLTYYRKHGPFQTLENFENRAFLFTKN